jgi:hypothetical protein
MTKDTLEQQVEDGNLFTHTALSQLADRLNRVEALLYAFADLCVDKNLIVPDELKLYNERLREALAKNGEVASAGVVMRVDPDEPPIEPQIDCKARLPHCKAACCSLQLSLVGRGDPGRPAQVGARPPVLRAQGRALRVRPPRPREGLHGLRQPAAGLSVLQLRHRRAHLEGLREDDPEHGVDRGEPPPGASAAADGADGAVVTCAAGR